jgi:RNA polymerase sigma factor (sigma-70 family)
LTDFVEHQDEAAFEHLVERHARHVWSVCYRLLGNSADAEDAFQATFVVLIRSGRLIAERGPLGGWLYQVAYRVALKARAMAARRRQMEQAAATPEVAPTGSPIDPDLSEALNSELDRLPEPCRLAVLLCDLDGLPRKEAAAKLGWKDSTLAGRLERGRQMLARRLRLRGFTAPVVLAATGGAVIPPCVAASTVSLARALVVARAGIASGAVPATVAELATGILRDMTMRIATKVLATAVLIAGVLGGIGPPFRASFCWPSRTGMLRKRSISRRAICVRPFSFCPQRQHYRA